MPKWVFADTITFTIDDVTYKGKEGMTWVEWVNSKYNTIGATTREDNGLIYTKVGETYGEHELICTVENNIYTYMDKNDVINNNVSYVIAHHGAGD